MMDDVKHTPGPWVIRMASNGLPYQVCAVTAFDDTPGRVGKSITRWGAISLPSSDEGKANARLIAAAPDMLEALRGIKKQVEKAALDGCWWIDAPDRGGIDVAAIDAAIAKATGGA